MKPKKQSIAAWIDIKTCRNIEQFQKKLKIPTKSQAVDIILSEYFKLTKDTAHKEPKESSKIDSLTIICQFSDITAKMHEFESKLKKELNKK